MFSLRISVFFFFKGTMNGYLYCENESLEWLPNNVGFIPNLIL